MAIKAQSQKREWSCIVFGVILNELVNGSHGIESGVRKEVFFADDNMAEQSDLSRTRNTTTSSSSATITTTTTTAATATTTTTTTTTTTNNNNS